MRYCFLVLLLISTLACDSTTAPSSDVAGTWAEKFSFPGASLVVTLDQTGNGTGTYAIEAGRSGTLQVTGTYRRPTVTWVLSYDYGAVEFFAGTLVDAGHISGSFADSTGMVTFTRH